MFVAAGDVDGDGRHDIVTGAGAGGLPQVNIFLDPGLIDGDPDGDAVTNQVSGRDASGTPNLKLRNRVPMLVRYNYVKRPEDLGDRPPTAPLQILADGEAVPSAAFFALPTTFTGGVNVCTRASFDGVRRAIAVAAGPGGGPEVALYDGRSLAVLDSFFAYRSNFMGGAFVS